MEYKKNDRVTLTIEDMGSDGEGIGKVDGFTLFIKDAVIGDQVEAKIIKSKKHMCSDGGLRRGLFHAGNAGGSGGDSGRHPPARPL